MEPEITVVVVDDHPLFRFGVVETLQAERDIEVVGQADSVAAAVSLTKSQLPDIVLLDLGIPGGGLEAAELIAADCPSTRIVVLTASEAEGDLQQALRLGAKAYVVKGVSGSELVRIIRSVAAGDAYVTPSLAATLLVERSSTPRRDRDAEPVDSLTAREQEVLELVADAWSNKEIAAKLSISEKTVKHHVTNILDKLQARNRVEAALRAHGRTIGHDRS